MDEVRLLMANDNCPDIFGFCETFMNQTILDNQVAIDGYDFFRKDRTEIQDKVGGGIIIYFRNTIKCKRRTDLEISHIETIWMEIELPNSKHFLFCSTYRPPNTYSSWIDLFEEELSIAQATGLEFILMGDFNIDLNTSTNNKWIHLIQLFDLSQLVTEPTRVTETTATIIDHIYVSNPENMSNCFVSRLSISDHFPICFSRKVNHKLTKNKHTINSYRSYKHFDETKFLADLSLDLDNFEISYTNTVEDDLAAWSTTLTKHLNKHAPIKSVSKPNVYLTGLHLKFV